MVVPVANIMEKKMIERIRRHNELNHNKTSSKKAALNNNSNIIEKSPKKRDTTSRSF